MHQKVIFENLTRKEFGGHNLRDRDKFYIPIIRSKNYYNSFFPFALRAWNDLDRKVKTSETLEIFKSSLKRKEKPKTIILFW